MTSILIVGVLLTTIHPAAFTDVTCTLQSLRIIDNILYSVPGEALQVLTELQLLQLDKNQITGVNKGCFDKLKKLTTLMLSNNMLSSISNESFKEMSSLEKVQFNGNELTEQLDLSGLAKAKIISLQNCSIRIISSPLFQRKSNVQEINLSSNGLSLLHPLAFSHMIETTFMRLENNFLTTDNVCSLVWQTLISLKHLILYNNTIHSILPHCFYGLTSLLLLNVDKSNITRLEKNAFRGLESLEVLQLRYNRLETLTNGTFTGLHNLQMMNLDENNIRTINAGTFSGLINLRQLMLTRNNLDTPYICFSVWNFLTALQDLNLHTNAITSILTGCFNILKSLQILHLGRNNISVLGNEAFGELESLVNIDLSHNKLSAVKKGSFRGLFNLLKLNLQDNKITTVDMASFLHLRKLKILNLNGNKLIALSSDVFPKILNQVLYVKIRQNMLICSCSLAWVKTQSYSISRYQSCNHGNGSGTSNLNQFVTSACQTDGSSKPIDIGEMDYTQKNGKHLVIAGLLIAFASCILVAMPIIICRILNCPKIVCSGDTCTSGGPSGA